MALDNAAADAAIDAWIAGMTPAPTPDQKIQIRDSMRGLARALYAGIVANAVVSPAGTTPMVAGGVYPVTGTGKIT